MTLALKILDRALREDFGFRHLLWVYSGRRGIHCWVSDPQAKRLGPAARSAVAEYLQLLKGGDAKTKKVNLRDTVVHPSVEKAIDLVQKVFHKLCLEDQDVLGDQQRWEKVLALIPSEEVRAELRKDFETLPNSVKRWAALERRVLLASQEGRGRLGRVKLSERTLWEIMLQYAYPRLDINVSKGLNHLLKSPFCAHPKTGRVCVPICPSRADSFDPAGVPTLKQVAEEINAFAREEGDKKLSKEFKKTSLKEPMRVFEEFLAGLAETWRGQQMEANGPKLDF